MQIITAAVIKGGTGKTTTCTALAQAAAKAGKRVLAVDLDGQADFSFSLAADQNKPGSYDLLNGTPAQELIQTTAQGIDVITGSPDLITIKTASGSAKRLRTALQPIAGNYDFVFVDVPPAIGEMQFNALEAATGLIIPLEADAFSLQGFYKTTDIAIQMQRSNPALKVLGIVITRYNNRPNINRYLKEEIAKKGAEAGAPLLATIRSGVAIVEANAMQQSLFDIAPNSNPAQDYAALYKTITELTEG